MSLDSLKAGLMRLLMSLLMVSRLMICAGNIKIFFGMAFIRCIGATVNGEISCIRFFERKTDNKRLWW